MLALHLLHPTLRSGGPASTDHVWTVPSSGFWLGPVAGLSQEIRGRLERQVGHVFSWLLPCEVPLGWWCPSTHGHCSSEGCVLLLVFSNCPLVSLGREGVIAPLLLALVPAPSPVLLLLPTYFRKYFLWKYISSNFANSLWHLFPVKTLTGPLSHGKKYSASNVIDYNIKNIKGDFDIFKLLGAINHRTVIFSKFTREGDAGETNEKLEWI